MIHHTLLTWEDDSDRRPLWELALEAAAIVFADACWAAADAIAECLDETAHRTLATADRISRRSQGGQR